MKMMSDWRRNVPTEGFGTRDYIPLELGKVMWIEICRYFFCVHLCEGVKKEKLLSNCNLEKSYSKILPFIKEIISSFQNSFWQQFQRIRCETTLFVRPHGFVGFGVIIGVVRRRSYHFVQATNFQDVGDTKNWSELILSDTDLTFVHVFHNRFQILKLDVSQDD